MSQVATNDPVMGVWPAAQGPRITFVILMVIVLVAFYLIGSGFLLDQLPDDGFTIEAIEFPGPWKAYGALLNWLALSYVAFAAACALTIAGVSSIIRLPLLYRGVAIAAFVLLTGFLVLQLQSAGNRTFDVAWRSICGPVAVKAQREAGERTAAVKAKQGEAALSTADSTSGGPAKQASVSAAVQTFCAHPNKVSAGAAPVAPDKQFGGAVTFIKYGLNGAFQTGAAALLTAFLMWCAVDPRTDLDRRRNANVKSLFYCTSLLLTLIILTDAMFHSFIRDLVGEGLPLVAYQQALVFYFAVLSSGTLGLAALGGYVLSNGGILERAKGQEGITSGAGQVIHHKLLGSLGSFVSSPPIAGVLATFAPIISALVTTWLGWDPTA